MGGVGGRDGEPTVASREMAEKKLKKKIKSVKKKDQEVGRCEQ